MIGEKAGVRPDGKSVRAQLRWMLALVAATPLVVVALFLGAARIRTSDEAAEAALYDAARSSSISIELFLDQHLAAIEVAALEAEIEDPEALSKLLARIHEIYPGFLTLLAAGEEGKVLGSSPVLEGIGPVGDRPYFTVPMAEGRSFVSPVFRGRGFGDEAIVAISAPVVDEEGRRRGILEGSLDLAIFRELVGDYSLFREATSLVLDGEGQVVFSSIEDHPVLSSIRGTSLGRELAAPQLSFRYSGESPDPRTFVVGCANTARNWRVCHRQPLEVVEAIVRKDLAVVFGWILAVIGVAVAASRPLATVLTRPLRQLELALSVIREGRKPRYLEVQGSAPREIHSLSRDFQLTFEMLDETTTRLQRSLNEAQELRQQLEEALADREEEIAERTRELEDLNRILDDQAHIDPLTRIANRRRFDKALQVVRKQAWRRGEVFSILLVDVDHFKAFNDRWGHPGGDACLVQVAQVLAGYARRPLDLVARFGGEEFALILDGLEISGARVLAERIRESVAGQPISGPGLEEAFVTVSIGCASGAPESAEEAHLLLEAADRALYRAKAEGRNRVCG